MFNSFQWNCFNLVDTCNTALMLFLKCDVSKFRIPPLLSQNVTLSRPPPPPLMCDVIYGCLLMTSQYLTPKISMLWRRDLDRNVFCMFSFAFVYNTMFSYYFTYFWPPSSHPTFVCFFPVGLSFLIQHFQQILWVLKFLLWGAKFTMSNTSRELLNKFLPILINMQGALCQHWKLHWRCSGREIIPFLFAFVSHEFPSLHCTWLWSLALAATSQSSEMCWSIYISGDLSAIVSSRSWPVGSRKDSWLNWGSAGENGQEKPRTR